MDMDRLLGSTITMVLVVHEEGKSNERSPGST
jgi:hypothetical protein